MTATVLRQWALEIVAFVTVVALGTDVSLARVGALAAVFAVTCFVAGIVDVWISTLTHPRCPGCGRRHAPDTEAQ